MKIKGGDELLTFYLIVRVLQILFPEEHIAFSPTMLQYSMLFTVNYFLNGFNGDIFSS